jgi:hypothetical protein
MLRTQVEGTAREECYIVLGPVSYCTLNDTTNEIGLETYAVAIYLQYNTVLEA